MKKSIITLLILLALPVAVFRAQTENDSEVLEFKLNDFYSIKLRQISESEYTDQKEKSEHLRHKPYEVITDVAQAQKMLGERLKRVKIEEDGYDYDRLEVTYKDGVKKMLNIPWLGWNKENNNFVAYYPKAGVLILNNEADGDYPIDLNDRANEHVGNPKYYAFSPDRQFRINGNFDGGAIDGITYWLEKWNKSEKKYEFIEYLEEAADYMFWFNCTQDWFWTNNTKALCKYVCEHGSYYEMELIAN